MRTTYSIYTLIIEGGYEGFFQSIQSDPKEAEKDIMNQYHDYQEQEGFEDAQHHHTLKDVSKYWGQVEYYQVPISFCFTDKLNINTNGYIRLPLD